MWEPLRSLDCCRGSASYRQKNYSVERLGYHLEKKVIVEGTKQSISTILMAEGTCPNKTLCVTGVIGLS